MHKDIEAEKHRARLSELMPKNPAGYGWKGYSQNDEDGIIRYILEKIYAYSPDTMTKTFFEAACSNGLECNTHQLVLDDYRGVWVEGNIRHINYIESILGGLSFPDLLVLNWFIKKETIEELADKVIEKLNTKDLDLFSWDTDGNDLYFVLEFLNFITPKVICVEYNAKFPPPSRMCITYNSDHSWNGTDYYGASLQTWVENLKDYTLVCCNVSGVNAFFVRNDLSSCFPNYSINELYQPLRLWLAQEAKGHPSSLAWLRDKLTVPKK